MTTTVEVVIDTPKGEEVFERTETRKRSPRLSPDDLDWARSQARKIIEAVGLDYEACVSIDQKNRPGRRQWVFADADGHWWSFLDPSSQLEAIKDSEPPCWRVGAFDYLSPDDLPPKFYEALGEWNGPLHWALCVLANQVLKDQAKQRLITQAAALRGLMARPEWAAMEKVVRSDGDAQATQALGQLRALATSSGEDCDFSAAYRLGFGSGEAMGYFTAVAALRRHERKRRARDSDFDEKLVEAYQQTRDEYFKRHGKKLSADAYAKLVGRPKIERPSYVQCPPNVDTIGADRLARRLRAALKKSGQFDG